ncbi:MAG: hypothetical protein P1U87_02560 [Verrucomicrobiales bacterium]|nr:hypothetical protein [Verrucomicrobiales bacterium]
MKKAILVATISALTLGVNAGDWGKAPIPAKAPIEECLDIGGSISTGYMSEYIFYGYRFSRDSVWTDVNYTFDSIVPINIGAWYLNGIGETPGYDELDLYISAELGSFAGFDTSLAYTYFFFPEGVGVGSYGELGLDISRSLGFVDFAWESNYAMLGRTGDTGGAWYHQASLSKEFGITDSVALVLSTGVGYSDGYASSNYLGIATGSGNGFNHYFVTAELPITLNCRATLTPYLSYNGAPDGWVADGANGFLNGNLQSDILSAGVSLSVSF